VLALGNGDARAHLASGRRFGRLWFPSSGVPLALERRPGGVAVYELGSSPREAQWIPLPAGGARLTSADLSPDNAFVALGDSRGRVTAVPLAEGTPPVTVDTALAEPVRRVAVSEGGRLVAATTEGGVQVWSAASGSPVATLPVADATILRFLPTGDRLATAAASGPLRVWSGATGQEEWAFYGHVGRVTAVGGSPDGRTLVSGSAGGEVRFWDLRTGQELMTFQRHSGPVTHVEFGAGGVFLATAGEGLSGAGEVASWRGIRP
jgi:WD40 repeat protein